MDMLDIFPTPIGIHEKFISEPQRIDLYHKIKNTSHEKHDTIRGDGISTHTNQNMIDILDGDIQVKFKDCVIDYMNKFGLKRSLKLLNMWSNIQNKGSILRKHFHEGCVVSGAIYINVGDNSSITFHNPNPLMVYTERKSTNQYSDKTKLFVKDGTLLLFPSWLQHGDDDETIDMDDRVVISFNLVYEQ
jgi:uncharacterized protein (TIGR02466 family)